MNKIRAAGEMPLGGWSVYHTSTKIPSTHVQSEVLRYGGSVIPAVENRHRRIPRSCWTPTVDKSIITSRLSKWRHLKKQGGTRQGNMSPHIHPNRNDKTGCEVQVRLPHCLSRESQNTEWLTEGLKLTTHCSSVFSSCPLFHTIPRF